jgi:hypothetical protein
MRMHVRSSAVDWRLSYEKPLLGDEVMLEDLLSRIPDLQHQNARAGMASNCARVQEMSFTTDTGLKVKVDAKQFTPFKDSYINAGFNVVLAGEFYDVAPVTILSEAGPHAVLFLPTLAVSRIGQDGTNVLSFELKEYLQHNWRNLTNYAHAHRQGLRILSAPAESGMSQSVNQRMGKRQPMRRSAAGAHQLLQVRCPVLDCRLEAFFREWWPKFRLTPPVELQCVMCDKRHHVCSTPRHQPYCIRFENLPTHLERRREAAYLAQARYAQPASKLLRALPARRGLNSR